MSWDISMGGSFVCVCYDIPHWFFGGGFGREVLAGTEGTMREEKKNMMIYILVSTWQVKKKI